MPSSFLATERPLKARAYADLHGRGYTITSGMKFGGDFLVYRGDPSLCHAEFVLKVVAHPGPLHPLMLVAAARTAHAARKHYALCYLADGENGEDGESGEIRYVSFSPEGGFQEVAGS